MSKRRNNFIFIELLQVNWSSEKQKESTNYVSFELVKKGL